MKNNKILYIAVIGVMILSGCQTTQKDVHNEIENIKANELISKINIINNASPETISSSFTIDGNTG
jgi:outer membrane murein-binding lipoprotein Lpp